MGLQRINNNLIGGIGGALMLQPTLSDFEIAINTKLGNEFNTFTLPLTNNVSYLELNI